MFFFFFSLIHCAFCMKYTHFFCIRLHFTTKRQSQIIAFVSIVYVFFCFFFCATFPVTVNTLERIHLLRFSLCVFLLLQRVRCRVLRYLWVCLLISIGFLNLFTRCTVCSTSCPYSSKAELASYTTLEPIARNENCIKRIDNEFTRQILLRVLATVNVWRVEAATKWNIEQFHKVNGMSLIHTISLFTANIFINHQYSFTCSIKFEKLWLYGIIYTFSRKMLFCICDPSLVALLIVCTGHRKNRQKSHAYHFKLGKYRLRASTKLFTIHTIESS